MKKIFLVFGLTGICTAALSQQQDFFNLEKHLEKKSKQDKKAATKPITRNFSLPLLNTGTISKPVLSHILSNGDRVYLLPTDNMPCVSPDMTRYRTMPKADNDIRLFILRQRKRG